MRNRFFLLFVFLSLLFLLPASASVSAGVLQATDTPTVTPTATFAYSTPLGSPTPGSPFVAEGGLGFDCPVGTPQGYGDVAADPAWVAACSHCLPTATFYPTYSAIEVSGDIVCGGGALLCESASDRVTFTGSAAAMNDVSGEIELKVAGTVYIYYLYSNYVVTTLDGTGSYVGDINRGLVDALDPAAGYVYWDIGDYVEDGEVLVTAVDVPVGHYRVRSVVPRGYVQNFGCTQIVVSTTTLSLSVPSCSDELVDVEPTSTPEVVSLFEVSSPTTWLYCNGASCCQAVDGWYSSPVVGVQAGYYYMHMSGSSTCNGCDHQGITFYVPIRYDNPGHYGTVYYSIYGEGSQSVGSVNLKWVGGEMGFLPMGPVYTGSFQVWGDNGWNNIEVFAKTWYSPSCPEVPGSFDQKVWVTLAVYPVGGYGTPAPYAPFTPVPINPLMEGDICDVVMPLDTTPNVDFSLFTSDPSVCVILPAVNFGEAISGGLFGSLLEWLAPDFMDFLLENGQLPASSLCYHYIYFKDQWLFNVSLGLEAFALVLLSVWALNKFSSK